jgi:hypothetical protein
MVDYPTEVESTALLDVHVGRLTLLGGDPLVELSQDAADAIFWYMHIGAPAPRDAIRPHMAAAYSV